jgi:hypothetical protein
MDSYTITIAPNDDSGSSTRLVVDSSGGQVRITDVHLHAAEGLSSGHIPNVDFGLLLQAVTGGSPVHDTAGPATAVATAVGSGDSAIREIESSAPEIDEPERLPAVAGRRRATKAASARAATAPAPRSGRGRQATPSKKAAAKKVASRAAAQPAPAVKAPARKAATKKATPVRKAAPATKATPVRKAAPARKAAAKGRVYRRTPDDLAAVFEQMGSVAAVADHYQVPRYTAQGWVGRLRATR